MYFFIWVLWFQVVHETPRAFPIACFCTAPDPVVCPCCSSCCRHLISTEPLASLRIHMCTGQAPPPLFSFCVGSLYPLFLAQLCARHPCSASPHPAPICKFLALFKYLLGCLC